jgi:transposase
VCARDGLDLRCNPLDRPSCSRRGADIPDSDEQAMTSTHGYARDHRPDLKQGVLDLMVSEDGGIPVGRTSGDGKTSDIAMFQARAQAWLAAFQQAPHPRDLIADSKLSHEDHAPPRRPLGCITRMPNTMGSVAEVITPALAWDCWPRLDDHPRDQRLERCHDGMAQRWLVGSSQAADARAAATLNHARQRAREAIHKPLCHLQAQRVATPEAAHAALTAWAKGWTSHQVDACHLSDHQRSARTGRPTPRLPVKAIDWHIQPHVRPAEAAIEPQQPRHAGCVIGTTIGTSALQDPEVITADTRQSQVAGGFRWLKEPRCFVSSLLVKTPCRIQGLLRVMTLALLVYAVAPRRLRQPLAHHQATVPNHITQPTTTPT